MRLLLSLLLLLLPATTRATEDNFNFADPLEFIVYVMDDDVVRGYYSFPRTSGLDDFAAVTTATPNLDTLAAAGFVHQNFRSYQVCSPTRSTHVDLGDFQRENHSHGTVLPDSTLAEDSVFNSNTIWHSMGRAGYRSFFTGKWHITSDWSCASSRTETAQQAAGIDEADTIIAGNVLNQNTCFNYFVSGGCWLQALKGHNCWYQQGLDGTGALTTVHSSQAIYDSAIAYIQAKKAAASGTPPNYTNGGKHFLTVWLNGPHVPVREGTPAGDGCNGIGQNDWPPGSACIGSSADVFQEIVEYNDDRFGDLMTELDIGRDVVVYTSDNGDPNSHVGIAECEASRGKKGSPFPCGTWVPYVAWGKNVVGGSVMSAYQHRAVDFAPTLLGLAGGSSRNRFGKSFHQCITAANGYSASNCWGRDLIFDMEFSPRHSSTGLFRLMPDVTVDPSGMWNFVRPTASGFASDGRFYYWHREYDANTASPYSFFELLIESVRTSPSVQYLDAAVAAIAETTGPAGGAIDLTTDDDWDTTRTQAQIDFITAARLEEVRTRARRGRLTTQGFNR